jgi:acetylornithine deacetylase
VKTVVDHLLALVRIPSASSLSNRAVVEYAQAVLHHAQWSSTAHSYRDANGIEKINLIAAPPGQDPAKSNVDLAFLCHTDTVPPPPTGRPRLRPSSTRGCFMVAAPATSRAFSRACSP